MAGKLQVCRRFFKVMTPGFRAKLCLPVSFCRQFGGLKLNKASLNSSKGLWNVQVVECGKGLLCFEGGWGDFLKNHHLNLGDFVVFEHKGSMEFEVIVLDPSGCDKEFQLPNSSAVKERSSHKNDNINHSRSFKGQTALEAAMSYSPRGPHFLTTMKASNGCHNKQHLTIPVKFVESIKLNKGSSVNLRDPSRRPWPLNLYFGSRGTSAANRTVVRSGWREFYVENKLKEEDVCLFELDITEKRSNAVTLDVHIFPSSS